MRRPAPIVAATGPDTLRGAALMVASMACFAVEDALIKTLGSSGAAFPATQIIWMLGVGGATVLAAYQVARGRLLFAADLRHPAVLWRTVFEVAATLTFVPALILVPLATATAVLQATPLVVAAGAALFLGATVGWRRWAAIGVGFAGVLLVVRPGADFDAATLLAVAGTLGLAARDLVTRLIPVGVSNVRTSLVAFAALVPGGMAAQAALGQPVVAPPPESLGLLAATVAIGLAGYVTVVGAMRMGDVAVVTSFRYSRMVFALVLATAVFGERPDPVALTGIAIVIGAGLYTLAREARLASQT